MGIISCKAVIKQKVNADKGRLKVSSSVCEGEVERKEVENKDKETRC